MPVGIVSGKHTPRAGLFWNTNPILAKQNVYVRPIRTNDSSPDETPREKRMKTPEETPWKRKQKHHVWLRLLGVFSHGSGERCYWARNYIQHAGLFQSNRIFSPATPTRQLAKYFLAGLKLRDKKTAKFTPRFETSWLQCFECSFNTVLNPFLFSWPSKVSCFFNLKRKF